MSSAQSSTAAGSRFNPSGYTAPISIESGKDYTLHDQDNFPNQSQFSGWSPVSETRQIDLAKRRWPSSNNYRIEIENQEPTLWTPG
jgi:hypothetical protein